MMTPADALARAHYWATETQRRTGPARTQAMQAAAYWYEAHRRLVAGAALPPAPPPGVLPVGAVPPPVAAMPRGPIPPHPAYQAGVPRGPIPPHPAYQAMPGRVARPARAGATGLVVTLVVLGIALTTGLAVGASALVGGALLNSLPVAAPERVERSTPHLWSTTEPEPELEPEPEPEPVPEPVPDPEPEPSDPPQLSRDAESVWKSQVYAETLPNLVPSSASPTAFLPGYPTAEDWLLSRNAANADIQVAFTDDVAYNCGMEWVIEENVVESGVGGCFNPQYPRVLFMYWGPKSASQSREFVLAHELSHFIQWWQKYDVMRSAVAAGLWDSPEWYESVESDATCRVLSWGGYDANLAAESSSPCLTPSWSEDWLAQRLSEFGVSVTDY